MSRTRARRTRSSTRSCSAIAARPCVSGPGRTTAGRSAGPPRRSVPPRHGTGRADRRRVAVRPHVRRVGPLLQQRQLASSRHEVMAGRYLAAQPGSAARLAMRASRITARRRQVFPITKRPTFELLTEAGEFTSACAMTLYSAARSGDGNEGALAFRGRARAQPRAPRRPVAGGRHVHGAARRAGTRVPGGRRRLVPSGDLLHGSGRRAVRRGLLPRPHRAP